MHHISKGIAAGWLSLLLAAPAFGQDGTIEGTEIQTEASTEATEDAEEEDGKDWSVGFRLGSSIGQGTFVNVANDSEFYDPNCTDPIEQGCVGDAGNAFDRANLSFRLNGGYKLGEFSLGVTFAAVQWLTAGGGRNAPAEFRWQDTSLAAAWDGYTFDSIGLTIAPDISFTLPTSQVSQYSTLVVGTSLGVGVSKTFFDKLGLSLGLSGGKDFHRFTSPVLDPEKLGQNEAEAELRPEAVIYRAGGSEDVGRGLVAVSGLNTEYFFAGSLGARIPVWDKLTFSAGYSLATYWTYGGLSSDHPDFGDVTPDLEGINQGRGVAQLTRGSIGLGYPVELADVSLAFGLGLSTSQFPKTDDNQSFRFPFWNFSGAAANASAITASIGASY